MKNTLTTWSTLAVLAAALALLGASAVASRAAATAEAAPLVTAVFAVEGMTCGGCEGGVEIAVERLDGVRTAEASHEEGRATVTYDETKVTAEAIVRAIEKLGYRAKLLASEPAAAEPQAAGFLARLRECC